MGVTTGIDAGGRDAETRGEGGGHGDAGGGASTLPGWMRPSPAATDSIAEPTAPLGSGSSNLPAAGWAGRLAVAAGDIKLSHSVFALPFAVLGVFLASGVTARSGNGWSELLAKLGLVLVCMVLARTWAMLFNRLADARFDAANPRTARRAVASGRLARRDAWLLASVCAGGFVAAAGAFAFFGNVWPVMLAIPVLAWLAFYSLAKRFTALCHVLLGTALAISPLAAALAVDPAALGRAWALYAVAGMVTCWVAGFDIIYALQDLDFDRQAGLNSIPARIGWRGAIWVSRVLHAAAAGLLMAAWWVEPRFGAIFLAAVTVAVLVLIAEHVVLARRGRAGLEMAFFTLNGVVSCVVGAAGTLDLLL